MHTHHQLYRLHFTRLSLCHVWAAIHLSILFLMHLESVLAFSVLSANYFSVFTK